MILNVAWMTEHDFLRQLGVILPCSVVLLAMDGYVLAWWGAAEALKGDRYTRTVFRSFFLVIVPPLLVIVLLVAAAIGSAVTKETVQIIFVAWTIGSLIFDLVLLAKARSRLKYFRLLAAGDALPDTTNSFDNAQANPWRVVVAQ